MSEPKHRIRKSILWVIMLMLLTCGVFSFEMLSLNHHIERLQQEIENIEQTTATVRSTMPLLQSISRRVGSVASCELVPHGSEKEWISKLMLNSTGTLDITLRIEGRNPPLGTDLPWDYRRLNRNANPGLTPFYLQVHIAGELKQVRRLLSQIARHNNSMVVVHMNLARVEGQNTYEGVIRVAFPQIHYPEELQQIIQLAEMNPESF